jgi:hypothetical protein
MWHWNKKIEEDEIVFFKDKKLCLYRNQDMNRCGRQMMKREDV